MFSVLLSPKDSKGITGNEKLANTYPEAGLLKAVPRETELEASAGSCTDWVETRRPCSVRHVKVPVAAEEFGFIRFNCAPSLATGTKNPATGRVRNGTDSALPAPHT